MCGRKPTEMCDVLNAVFGTLMRGGAAQGPGPAAAARGPSPASAGGSSGVVLLEEPGSGSRSSGVVLLAEPGLSRSVLLLAAVTAASELDIGVLFFSHAHIHTLPACVLKSVPTLRPHSLKRIQFSYPRTLEEFLQQVAGLHESPSAPSLILVDGLQSFLQVSAGRPGDSVPSDLSCAAHAAALLCDTAAALGLRSSAAGPCRVIVSVHSEAADHTLDVLDCYFPLRCTLAADGAADGGEQQVWSLHLSGRGYSEAAGTTEGQDRSRGPPQWKVMVHPDGTMDLRPC